ncbi:hypothetical protein ADINL_2150 [Nitrincola lacisaponensis]|uniref:Uncharacterized protein n=1 Tax=Nitrincola lacisaponensis TaxID=267850 RepID=A0A063Y2P3_9GAMM|nr:hypothetical protein [Nitrincola lacisaponensis]KDE39021.1 hypothetical protein ADINL_2150 [Nitrincola lacisaponensis]
MKIDQTHVNQARTGHPDSSSRVNKLTASAGFGDLLEQMLQPPPQQREYPSATLPDAEEQSNLTDEAKLEQQREAVREQLLALLDMTPAERIRFMYLQSKGLTEEQLADLPPEERERIEEEIKAEIRRQIGGDDPILS